MTINLNNFEELAIPILNKLAESFPTFLGASTLPGEGDERNDVLSIFNNYDMKKVEIIKDYQSIDRVLVMKKTWKINFNKIFIDY